MAINKNFVIRNGLEVANNLIIADDIKNKVGIGTTNPLVELDVHGDVNAYRFYGDQVRYPDWQFFGNLFGTALRAQTVDNADFAEASNTANFATEAGNSQTSNFATSSGTSNNADNILILNSNVDSINYIHFNDATSGYDDVNISSSKLVFNPFKGNLGVGVNAINPVTNLQLNFYGFESGTGTFTAVPGISNTIDSFSVIFPNFKVADYTLLIQNGSNIHTQKVLIMQDGTVSHYQESCIMYEPKILVSVSSTITSESCVLQVTPYPEVTGNINYKFIRQTML